MNIRDAPDHDKIRFVHALFQFLIAELARCLSRSILSRSRRRNRLICVTQHMPQLFYRDARAKNPTVDRKSTRLNSSHGYISYAVFCLKKKTTALSAVAVRPMASRAASRK